MYLDIGFLKTCKVQNQRDHATSLSPSNSAIVWVQFSRQPRCQDFALLWQQRTARTPSWKYTEPVAPKFWLQLPTNTRSHFHTQASTDPHTFECIHACWFYTSKGAHTIGVYSVGLVMQKKTEITTTSVCTSRATKCWNWAIATHGFLPM